MRQDKAKQHYPEAGMDLWHISSLISQHGPYQLSVIGWKLFAKLFQIIICKCSRTTGQASKVIQRVAYVCMSETFS